jgi:spore germination protein YaaH
MYKFLRTYSKYILILSLIFVAGHVDAATTKTVTKKAVPAPALEISGWIPYWRKATGTAEALAHLSTFKEINLFGYTMKNDGTLYDAMDIDNAPWPELIAAAKAKKIRVVPTVMWSNGAAIDATLSNSKKRQALEDEIVAMVKEKKFDGVDIDFEGKKAETKKYYSLFLKGLSQRLGTKWLMCTIESRTPLESRYDTIPKDIQYANDFIEINKYCDRVRVMAYDQGTIDLVLNRARAAPYIPVSDPVWVAKTIELAAKTIAKSKLVIGIATYGYEYEMTKLSEYGYRYDLQWAFNPRYAIDLAASLGITPTRNASGEMSFMYHPVTPTVPTVPTTTPATDTGAANVASVVAGVAQNAPNDTIVGPVNIVWWSDAKAIKDKVDLARQLGVRGVALFKIDGGMDPAAWNYLK